MKAQRFILPAIGSVCSITLGLILSVSSFAQSNSSTDGSNAKATESSTNPLPLRLPANKDLPISAFRPKEYFVKDLLPGAVLENFEMVTYRGYLKKYTSGISGMPDVSSDRMVAVTVVNFPNGLKGERAEYSSARVVSAMDALTGQPVSYEVSGKVIRSFGPTPVFPLLK